MLTQGELDAIRAEAEELLLGRCTILTPTRVDLGGGRWKDAWAVRAQSVKCRLAPVSADIRGGEGGRAGDQPDDRSLGLLTLPAYTEIGMEDRVEVEGHDRQFEVTRMVKRTPFDEFVRRLEVREAAENVTPEPGSGGAP